MGPGQDHRRRPGAAARAGLQRLSAPWELLLPVRRLARWTDNFRDRHGETALAVDDGALIGTAGDGSSFSARLPFDREYAGPPTVAGLALAATPPDGWGLLLVRKGGFAVARLSGERTEESKVGKRHVQGRSKAGGQSQQRFARRRDNQARQAYEAAADHAARILGTLPRGAALVTGGDRSAVTAVLDDDRLRRRALTVTQPWLPVPDPRRAVLDTAIVEASGIRVMVRNA